MTTSKTGELFVRHKMDGTGTVTGEYTVQDMRARLTTEDLRLVLQLVASKDLPEHIKAHLQLAIQMSLMTEVFWENISVLWKSDR